MNSFCVTFAVLIASLAIVVAAPSLAKNKAKIDVQVMTVESINEFQRKNPTKKVVAMARVGSIGSSGTNVGSAGQNPSRDSNQHIVYTLGRRVGGDRLVAQSTNNDKFTTLNDVTLRMSYPAPDAEPGSGAVITYVEIEIDQSSHEGNAYIADGGIGARSITIVLEVKDTSYYAYDANVYGY